MCTGRSQPGHHIRSCSRCLDAIISAERGSRSWRPSMTPWLRSLFLLGLVLIACAGPSPSTRDGPVPGRPDAAPINRTLVMAGRLEAPSVSSRPLRTFGLTSGTVTRLFNAGLALRDGEGNFGPYLA